VGAALGVDIVCWQLMHPKKPYPAVSPFDGKEALIDAVRKNLDQTKVRPHSLIIGFFGRSGRGAAACLDALKLTHHDWGHNHTRNKGPFSDILDFHILINCALVKKIIPPFLTRDMIAKSRKLSVIMDVGCDPTSQLNPLPLYKHATTFSNPTTSIGTAKAPLDIIAIDHLPSLLPNESSEDFSAQLLPHLKDLLFKGKNTPVWQHAKATFLNHIQ